MVPTVGRPLGDVQRKDAVRRAARIGAARRRPTPLRSLSSVGAAVL